MPKSNKLILRLNTIITAQREQQQINQYLTEFRMTTMEWLDRNRRNNAENCFIFAWIPPAAASKPCSVTKVYVHNTILCSAVSVSLGRDYIVLPWKETDTSIVTYNKERRKFLSFYPGAVISIAIIENGAVTAGELNLEIYFSQPTYIPKIRNVKLRK